MISVHGTNAKYVKRMIHLKMVLSQSMSEIKISTQEIDLLQLLVINSRIVFVHIQLLCEQLNLRCAVELQCMTVGYLTMSLKTNIGTTSRCTSFFFSLVDKQSFR